MQKWEYQVVSADEAGLIWKPRNINDKEIPNWRQGQSLLSYINQIGKEGWELAAAPDGNYLIFKRPIE